MAVAAVVLAVVLVIAAVVVVVINHRHHLNGGGRPGRGRRWFVLRDVTQAQVGRTIVDVFGRLVVGRLGALRLSLDGLLLLVALALDLLVVVLGLFDRGDLALAGAALGRGGGIASALLGSGWGRHNVVGLEQALVPFGAEGELATGKSTAWREGEYIRGGLGDDAELLGDGTEVNLVDVSADVTVRQ